jgi:hypothetical protein
MMTLFRMKMSLPSKSTPVCGKSYPQTGQFRNTIGPERVYNRFNLRRAPCRRGAASPATSTICPCEGTEDGGLLIGGGSESPKWSRISTVHFLPF